MHIAGFFRQTTLQFVKKEHEHGDISTFYFKAQKPLKHLAGQHGLFLLPRFKGAHLFTLASAPEEELVAVGTHVSDSDYKQRLDDLQPGDKMTLIGPTLDFAFQEDVKKYVFLAQGIGITPFRSMLIYATNHRMDVSTTLLHVSGDEHTYRSITESRATTSKYVNGVVEFTAAIESTLDDEAGYYLSGSPKFIKATKQTLKRLGVERRRIRADSFWGY